MDNCIERVRSVFSGQIKRVNLINQGWSNQIVEVNDEWIFRFPRDKDSPQFRLESDFVAQFEQVSPVPIPSIESSEDGFTLYKRIPGVAFSLDSFQSLSSIQKRKVYRQLGEFLTCLHSFEFSHKSLCAFPYGGSDFWPDLWANVEGCLTPDVKNKAEYYFESYLESTESLIIPKSITHSDLGTNNTLLDINAGCLSGIIDFTDISVSDIAVDFNCYYRTFGQAFIEEVLNYYELPLGDNFWRRVEFESYRKSLFIIYYAKQYGYEEYIPSCIDGLNVMLSEI